MATIKQFEDLACWQKARELNRLIYKVSRGIDFARDSSLCDQIRRASVSVMSNIAEGFERGGDREFLQFLSQAKGSCGEIRSQMYTALDEKHVSENEFNNLSQLSTEVSRMLSGLMTYLRDSDMRGAKFKKAGRA